MDPTIMSNGTFPLTAPVSDARPPTGKTVEPRVMKKAVQDFVHFFDDTVERLYPFLLTISGSVEVAEDLATGVYLDAAKRSRRLFLRPELSIALLLQIAEENLKAVRSKGQGTSVEFSALDAIVKASPGVSTRSEGEREMLRRDLAVALTTLLGLPERQRQIFTLQIILGWSAREVAFLLRITEEQLTRDTAQARTVLVEGARNAGLAKDAAELLRELRATPRLTEDARQRLRTAVIEQYAHLRTTQVHLLVLMGAGAVIANALVSTVVAFAVVTDPLAPLQTETRAQLAAIDAQLLERRLSNLEQRLAVTTLRARADTVYAKQQLKDTMIAYGVLAIQEEAKERQRGSLAWLGTKGQLITTRFWIALEQVLERLVDQLL